MIRNYLNVLLRVLRKNGLHNGINIFGLTIGTGSFIILMLYVSHELSFDTFHEQYESLFRVTLEQKSKDGSVHTTLTSLPAGPALIDEYPSIESVARIRKAYRASIPVRYNEKDFYEDRIFDVDSAFFNVFTLPLSRGDENTAFNEPFSIVLTQEMANKYFGEEDPVGKTLILNKTDNFIITGVLKKIPSNTHLSFFDFLTSFSTASQRGVNINNWGAISVRTYIKMKPNASAEVLENELPTFTQKYLGEKMKEWGVTLNLSLQRVSDIHLHSHLEYEFGANNDIKNVKALAWIAFSILLISCINYINLATGNAITRAKEVGVRKSLGSNRVQLIRQFFSESTVISGCAVLLGFLLAGILSNFTESFIGYPLSLDQFTAVQWTGILAGLILLVSLASGFYPAIVLSSFQATQVLKASSKNSSVNTLGRKVLVAFQIVLSALLIFNSTVIFKQVYLLKNKELGFDKERVMVIPFQGSKDKSFAAQKAELLNNPLIVSNSFISNIPGEQFAQTGFAVEGYSAEELPYFYVMATDYDIVKTLGLSISEGRGFSRDFLQDSSVSYLINESTARLLNWSDPIGRKFTIDESIDGRVIGVVHDFHFTSLHQKIGPMAIFFRPAAYRYILMRIKTDGDFSQEGISSIRKTWEGVFPDLPFDYFFLEDSLQKVYQSEDRLTRTILLFSGVTICIAMIGLFALMTFTIRLRYKEIGIRKSLGATSQNVVILLSKEFFVIGLVSVSIASALGFYLMSNWLNGFSYKIMIGWEYFITTGFSMLLLIAAVIGYRCLSISFESPAKAIRHE